MTDPQLLLGRTGVNVDRAGGDPLDRIKALGLEMIRVPVTIADAGPPNVRHDLRSYLGQAMILDLKVLLVFDRDAYYWPDWRVRTADYVRFWLDYYAGLYTAIQVGNEADHESPSSWTMDAGTFGDLLRETRAACGPDPYLIAGGMASGQPDYLKQVDLSPVNAYGVHPYAKDAPNPNDTEDWPDVDELWHQYEAVSTLPAIMTEWGFPGSRDLEARQAEEVGEMVDWAGRHGTGLYYYNWRDGGENYGLWRQDGSPKPAAEAVYTAIAALPPLGTLPPPVQPTPTPGPDVDPWQWFGPAQIAAACDVPEANVREHWPRVVAQLVLAGINRRSVQRAVIPTIALETGGPDRSLRFSPVREAYWMDEEWRRANLAQYYPWYGRGLNQRTWRTGYLATGRLIALLWGTDPDQPTFNLVDNPDNLLDPDLAAADLAVFWRDTRALPTASWPLGYSLLDAADAGDTEWLRRLVQGGTAGLDRFRMMYAALGDAEPGVVTPPPAIVYDRSFPAIAQDDTWSCWPTSARWLLGAIGADADGDGLPPTEAYVEGQAIRDGIVSTDDGLLVASGGPAAAWLNDQWLSPLGLQAIAYPSVSYEDVIARTLEGGCLIGGRAWNHWVATTGVTPQGEITLMNPDPHYKGIGTVLSRDEFQAMGPFSAIAVAIGDQEDPAMIAELQAQLAQMTSERDQYHADRDRMMTYFAQAVDIDGDAIAAALAHQRALREEAIGARPAA